MVKAAAKEAAAVLKAYEEAGVTWPLRDMLPCEVPLSEAYSIVRGGPPGHNVPGV